jgi:hypothetical protein
VRRLLTIALLGLVLPAGAQAATLSLAVQPGTATPGSPVVFAGQLVPAQPAAPVGLYTRTGSTWSRLAQTATAADGTFRFTLTASRPGSFIAIAQPDPSAQVASPETTLRIRPRLAARVTGRRVVGERVRLTGRLLPAEAGKLSLRLGGKTRPVPVGPEGRFSLLLPSDLPGRHRWRLALAPAAGYEAAAKRNTLLLRAPPLARGSAGPSVRALERRLAALHYVFRSVDSYYGSDTYEAVMAFQKVHGLRRTGSVTPALWGALARAGVPRAFVPRGTHIEVSKTKQVMYEVVNGEVKRVVHVSTGLTGNTPVGRWRVYRVDPGYNAIGMYYSLYFLRGFAIHGYKSVPPYPASHGFVRTPIWFAPGFYARWARLGTQIHVFP